MKKRILHLNIVIKVFKSQEDSKQCDKYGNDLLYKEFTSESQKWISGLTQSGQLHTDSQRSLESVNVTLYGNKVFPDMIKLRIFRWGDSSWIKCNHKCPYKKEEEKELAQTEAEKRSVITELGIGVMWPLAKDANSSQRWDRWGTDFSPVVSGGNKVLPTPWFWTSETDFRLLPFTTMKGCTGMRICL